MGFGRGKVILLGEHAVVHGYPAIAAGIERGVHAEARQADEDVLRLEPWDLTIAPDPEGEEPLARAFAAVLADYPDRPALEVHARVELPAGAGLGCSAAIGVAIVDSIDEALDRRRSRAEVGEAALRWERVFHGNPSGVDNTMSALGGVALFRRGQPLEPLHSNKPLHLVVGLQRGVCEHQGDGGVGGQAAPEQDPEPGDTRRSKGSRRWCATPGWRFEAGDLVALGQLLDLNHSRCSAR